MSENSLVTDHPTRQAAAVEGRSQRNRVTGKLRVAVEAMVWDRMTRQEAAKKAGLADHSLSVALKKTHVMRFYNSEIAALRNSLRPLGTHTLKEIMEKGDNDAARVKAVQVLENMHDVAEATVKHPGAQKLPGLIIVVNNGTASPHVIAPSPSPMVDVTPSKSEPPGD